MNRHDIADQEVVPAQFLAFALACALVLFGSLFPSAFSGIAYKLADAVFITGCVLVAMKLALTPRQNATSLIIHADPVTPTTTSKPKPVGAPSRPNSYLEMPPLPRWKKPAWKSPGISTSTLTSTAAIPLWATARPLNLDTT